MNTLEFHTPTQVDLREIFTLGLGSKRGDSTKIGHKGSGMKFTLALLHRLGSFLEVSVDGKTWRSTTKKILIRDIEHEIIFLVNDETEISTHITVTAGADTWKEPWFALRELVQNCIDEGGTSYDDARLAPTNPAGTIMRIYMTDELYQAWNDAHLWYNKRHPEIAYEGPTRGLFYHGFLIYEDKEWSRAYDVTDLLDRDKLSEDRQVRNLDFSTLFRSVVEKASAFAPSVYRDLLADEPATDIRHLAQAINRYIHKESVDIGGFKMAEFEAAWRQAHGEKTCWTLSGDDSADAYHAGAAGYKPIRVRYNTSLLAQYSCIPSAESLMPAIHKRLAYVSPKSIPSDALERLKMALKITKRLRPDGCKVEVVKVQHERDELRSAGLAVPAENKVLLLESHVHSAPLLDLVNTLVEEFMHLQSGASDCSRKFEEGLIAQITVLLMPKPRNTAEVL